MKCVFFIIFIYTSHCLAYNLIDKLSGEYFTTIVDTSYKTNEFMTHEVSIYNYADISNNQNTKKKYEFIGLSYGNKYIDVFTSPWSFTYSRRDNIGIITPLSLVILYSTIYVYSRYSDVDSSGSFLLSGLRSPEIRVFPIYPLQVLCGYDFDMYMIDLDSYKSELDLRVGIGINLMLFRIKSYFVKPIFRNTQSMIMIQFDFLTIDFANERQKSSNILINRNK